MEPNEEENDLGEDEKFYELADYIESLGLRKLAREIRYESRFSKLLDATLLADRWNFEADFLERREEKIQQHLQEIQSRTFDKAQAYNNIIVTLGYAGIFAIWSFVNEQLSTFDRALIAFLAGISLILFVIWTLASALKASRMVMRGLQTYSKEYQNRDDLLAAIEDQKAFENASVAKQMRWYPIIFAFSAGTGLASGLILSALLAGQIIGYPFTFGGTLQAASLLVRSVVDNM